MISSEAGADLEKLATGPAAVQLQKNRGVYWLPCTTASEQDGVAVPLCAVRKEAEAKEAPLAVEDGVERGIAQGSAAAAAAQPSRPGSSDDHLKLDESEESRKPDVTDIGKDVSADGCRKARCYRDPRRLGYAYCL